MPHSFTIERTRLITELFRVEAETEDDACDLLSQCDTVQCEEGVEQLSLSTVHSEVSIKGDDDAA